MAFARQCDEPSARNSLALANGAVPSPRTCITNVGVDTLASKSLTSMSPQTSKKARMRLRRLAFTTSIARLRMMSPTDLRNVVQRASQPAHYLGNPVSGQISLAQPWDRQVCLHAGRQTHTTFMSGTCLTRLKGRLQDELRWFSPARLCCSVFRFRPSHMR